MVTVFPKLPSHFYFYFSKIAITVCLYGGAMLGSDARPYKCTTTSLTSGYLAYILVNEAAIDWVMMRGGALVSCACVCVWRMSGGRPPTSINTAVVVPELSVLKDASPFRAVVFKWPPLVGWRIPNEVYIFFVTQEGPIPLPEKW